MTPQSRGKLGFYLGNSGAHAGRSLMLADLQLLLEQVPETADAPRYAAAVLQDNVLGKATVNNRDHALRRLRQLYGLDTRLALFRAFRRLWSIDPASRPLLSALMGMARDFLFRACFPVVRDLSIGKTLDRGPVVACLDEACTGRLSPHLLRVASGHVLSSWTQAGYLSDNKTRTRQRPQAGIGACAFALFLGWLEGERGALLLKSFWAQALDLDPETLLNVATQASRAGLLELLNAGSVVELRFPGYLTDEELQLP